MCVPFGLWCVKKGRGSTVPVDGAGCPATAIMPTPNAERDIRSKAILPSSTLSFMQGMVSVCQKLEVECWWKCVGGGGRQLDDRWSRTKTPRREDSWTRLRLAGGNLLVPHSDSWTRLRWQQTLFPLRKKGHKMPPPCPANPLSPPIPLPPPNLLQSRMKKPATHAKTTVLFAMANCPALGELEQFGGQGAEARDLISSMLD
ncbi:hypothetical protein BU17DRAFT_71457 [Hysterangium stoloniferum]|nr:hypothetical protein BU17DRAFT_71457 [Hysterangium stoloniferum]